MPLNIKNNDILIENLHFSISALSDLLNIHQRTLRIYDKEGILTPKRNSKNRRCYTLEDFEKAKLILFLTRNLALNLSGVKIILSLLRKSNLNSCDYFEYVKDAADLASIDTKVQLDNVKKMAKKGRRLSKSF